MAKLNAKGKLDETGSGFFLVPKGEEGVGYVELGSGDGLLYQPILIENLEGTLNSGDLVTFGK